MQSKAPISLSGRSWYSIRAGCYEIRVNHISNWQDEVIDHLILPFVVLRSCHLAYHSSAGFGALAADLGAFLHVVVIRELIAFGGASFT
jgi:hypothetical protein